jgi:hypothetical protein
MSLPDDFAGRVQKPVWRLAADVYRVARLQNVQFLDDLEQDVGNLADTIFTIAGDTADIDVGKIIVGAALTCGNTDFGRRRVIIDLDPETAKQFLGPSWKVRGLFAGT